MIAEILPIALLSPDKEDEVITFLQQLDVPDRRKKHALVEWCNYTGVVLTEELVDKLLGDRSDRQRG